MFEKVEIAFSQELRQNVFAGLRNKTLAETLLSARYASLSGIFSTEDREMMRMPVGEALLLMKSAGNGAYRRFLNPYGDLTYTRFRLMSRDVVSKVGLYRFMSAGQVLYIGRCRDGFGKRFNAGYGAISPKNCYRDGQATNCRVNALLAESSAQVEVEVAIMSNLAEIEVLERELISSHRPSWNLALIS